MARRVVQVRNVTVLLGRFPALARASFDAFEGEVVVLEGPNGSGKTTLLRLLLGLVVPAEGEVVVFGVDPARMPSAVRRASTYLGHQAMLYDELTADENLAFFERLRVLHAAQAAQLLERLGVDRRERGRQVRHLSQGQRRKVALATALAKPAELVLLDEPHAALDPEGKALLDDVIVDLARGGRTVVLASHDPGRSGRIATRRYRVVAGHPREVPAC